MPVHIAAVTFVFSAFFRPLGSELAPLKCITLTALGPPAPTCQEKATRWMPSITGRLAMPARYQALRASTRHNVSLQKARITGQVARMGDWASNCPGPPYCVCACHFEGA